MAGCQNLSCTMFFALLRMFTWNELKIKKSILNTYVYQKYRNLDFFDTFLIWINLFYNIIVIWLEIQKQTLFLLPLLTGTAVRPTFNGP